MAAFLLWNTNRKNLDSLVQDLVREHKIDILLLVEYYPSETKSTLSTLLLTDGLVRRNSSERFGVFSRLNYGMNSAPVMALGDRVELWNWFPEPNKEARFALVHGLDRMHNDDGTRRVFFHRIVDAVRQDENKSHRRTIVVGDFNAHPFESAILSSDGLHAIGIRQVGAATRRLVRWGSEEEDFFYNPMWRMYGHVAPMEAGMATHYWQKYQAGELFWHMLDQVVIRPEESGSFPEDHLKIISRVGTATLLAPDGTPDKTVGSDHLPIVFHWNV
jgi:Endonuclease/Exonuclease/phosphatase family